MKYNERMKIVHWGYLASPRRTTLFMLVHFLPRIWPAWARFSKVPVTLRARNQIFKSKYKE